MKNTTAGSDERPSSTPRLIAAFRFCGDLEDLGGEWRTINRVKKKAVNKNQSCVRLEHSALAERGTDSSFKSTVGCVQISS